MFTSAPEAPSQIPSRGTENSPLLAAPFFSVKATDTTTEPTISQWSRLGTIDICHTIYSAATVIIGGNHDAYVPSVL